MEDRGRGGFSAATLRSIRPSIAPVAKPVIIVNSVEIWRQSPLMRGWLAAASQPGPERTGEERR